MSTYNEHDNCKTDAIDANKHFVGGHKITPEQTMPEDREAKSNIHHKYNPAYSKKRK